MEDKMRARFLAIISCTILVLVSGVLADAITLSVSYVEGEAGSTVQASINIDSDVEAVGSMDITLNYDKNLLTAKEVINSDAVAAGFTVVSNLAQEGKIILGAISQNPGAGSNITSGSLFNIAFEVNADAAAGSESALAIEEAVLSDVAGDEIPNLGVTDGKFTVAGDVAPSITSVSPSSRAVGTTGQTIVITGDDFQENLFVTFEGLGLPPSGVFIGATIKDSTTQITLSDVDFTNATVGSGSIFVTNPDGGQAFFSFTVNVAPSITSVSPSSRAVGATGQTIVITCANCQENLSVDFDQGLGGVVIGATTEDSATQITLTDVDFTNATVGSGSIFVTNPDGGQAFFPFTVNAAPSITSVSPSSRAVGATGQTLVITGADFQENLSVTFEDLGSVVIGATTKDSATQITLTDVDFTNAMVSSGSIRVTNPDAGTATAAFTVNVAQITVSPDPIDFNGVIVDQPADKIVSIGNAGNANLNVTNITSDLGTSLDISETSFTVTPGDATREITLTLTASTPGAISSTLTITSNDPNSPTEIDISAFAQPPLITTAVSPSNGPTAGGTEITITGENFVDGATVTIGGQAATDVVVASVTEITAKTPAGTAGSADVVIRNPDGQSVTLTAGFIYIPSPTVIAISPASGPVAGGIEVTITGENFVDGATVTIGGNDATDVTFVSATAITATTPAGSVGAADVLVTNPDGQAGTLTAGFTYDNPPVITTVSPQGTIDAVQPDIVAQYEDADSGVELTSIKLTVDGSEIADAQITETEIRYTPTDSLKAGLHIVLLELKDKVGNPAQKQWDFMVEEVAPIISALTPQPDGKVSDARPTISAEYSDAGAGIDIAAISLQLDGADVTADATVEVSQIRYIPPVNVATGAHTIVLTVADRAGNQAATAEWSFTRLQVVSVSIPERKLFPGDSISIPIEVNDATGITSGELNVVYNASLLRIISVKSTDLTEGFSIDPELNVSGRAEISLANATGIETGSGGLLELVAEISESAPFEAEIPLTLDIVELRTEGAVAFQTDLKSGKIVIGDNIPPEASLTINDKAEYTNSRTVTLTIQASDDGSGVAQMQFSDDNENWSDFEAYSPTKTWELASGDGVKNVHVQLQDAAGNLASDMNTIILDSTPPADIRMTSKKIHTPINAEITIDFGEAINDELVDENIEFVGEKNREIAGEFAVDGNVVRFTPKEIFQDKEEVTVIIKTGIRDVAGNPLEKPIEFNFTTGISVWPGNANEDDIVNIRDIVPLGRYWGKTGEPRSGKKGEKAEITWSIYPAAPWDIEPATYADTNGDGTVNAEDIEPIAKNWQEKKIPAAPTGEDAEIQIEYTIALQHYEEMLEVLEGMPVTEGVRDLKEALKRLISQKWAQLIPETKLFQNYPNPFNPETWIPYQLAQDSEVTISIYSQKGQLVRLITLGAKPVGRYVTKDRAAYWDGKNNAGEKVASSLYFYQIKTGDFTATRKMVIVK